MAKRWDPCEAICARFEVLTAALLFWRMMLYRLLNSYRRFGRIVVPLSSESDSRSDLCLDPVSWRSQLLPVMHTSGSATRALVELAFRV
jgi:hypothetical protein